MTYQGALFTDVPARPRAPRFEMPDGMGDKDRRVLAYVNAEVERYRAGDRTEPIDLIVQAAEERLNLFFREHGRRADA